MSPAALFRSSLAVLLALAGAACAKQPAAPEVPAVDRPAVQRVEAPRDASVDVRRDAQPDGPADAAPGRRHAHRTAEPRPAPAGGFKVSGAIGRTDAETVLRGARSQLVACFKKARAQASDLEGRVTFRLSIDGRGRVPLAAVVPSTLGGGDPELCMVEALRDLKFPPSPSGAESTLTFPMTFRN
ncbi:MAG: AgmX/PglI C-terminal domain-containing protein [Verrucomicrobiota bacterium]